MQRPPTAAKILIVEDNPSDVQLFKDIFSEYRVFKDFSWTKTGDEALRFIRQNRPDLVLLDTILPIRDGFEILEEIKGEEDLKGTKVVMVSGSDDLSYVRKRAPMADGFLAKPVTLEGLASVVSQIDGFCVGVIKI